MIHIKTFDSLSEAEDFAKQFVGNRKRKTRRHLIDYSDYWKCYIVTYEGRAK